MNIKKNVVLNIIKIIIILALMIILTLVYNYVLKSQDIQNLIQEEKKKVTRLFDNIEENVACLELYTVYGNHLNFNGYILKECVTDINLKDVKLVIKDVENNVNEYSLKYDIQGDKVTFKFSDNINEGIDLNKITQGEFYLFIKLTGDYNEKEVEKLFSIKNISSYGEQDFYTITQNEINNKVEILFRNYSEKSLEYMQLKVEESTLPSRVYDIVIDAGHGGRDGGASYNGKNESDFTLEYSILLKQKLEQLGYKVKLTRTKDEYVESYGKDGRAVVPYETEAKMVLSIHLNSTVSQNVEGGVEIYAPNKANLSLAKAFADNIVNYTGTKYSVNSYARVLDGVYVRTYTEAEIKEAIDYANDLGYTPYESLSIETPYLFMIRETGGIMTRAYVDGRNTYIDDNPYYNSNISAEAYLLELGFINCENDVNNLLKNKDAYINAIVDSIVENYK